MPGPWGTDDADDAEEAGPDPLAPALLERVGGLSGRRARPHWWWTPARVLLALTTLTFVFALAQHAPCFDSDWSGSTRYRMMCYSDVPYLYTGRGFAEQSWPYAESRYPAMEYPVVISYAAWALSVAVAVAPAGPPPQLRAAAAPDQLWSMAGMISEVNQYFVLTALVLFVAALVAVLFLAGASPGRPWDAVAFATSPMLLLTGLINWDLLAVVCVAGALWAWARGRPLLTGAFIGLGVATKLYPLFLLGAVLVICLRRRHDGGRAWAVFARVAGSAALVWALVNVPAWLGPWDRWSRFWSFNSARGPDLGSIWLAISQRGYSFTAHDLNQATWALFALACLGILLLGLRAPATPSLAQLGFLIVAAFLLVNKVYSPQYVLWLLPLAVIARPRWRDLLIWQAGELIYFGAVWLYLGGWLGDAGGQQSTAYVLAILVRMGAELYLMARVVADVRAGRTPGSQHPNRADPEPADPDPWRPGPSDSGPSSSGQLDPVEGGGGEPAAHGDLLTDVGHPR